MSGRPDRDRNPWWDPMGAWQYVGESLTDAAVDPRLSDWGARNPLQALLDSLRAGLVGRPVAVGKGARRVAFTLSSLDGTVSNLAAAAGQAEDVAVSAEDVEFRSYTLASVSARLGNVHTRFATRPVLVAAPIDVAVVVTVDEVSAFLAERFPAVDLEVTDASRMFVRYARQPHWGYVEVQPTVENGGVVIRPIGVGRGPRLWRFRRRLVPLRPKLRLPAGMRITGVDLRPGAVEAHLRVDEWKLDHRALAALVRKPGQGREPDSSPA